MRESSGQTRREPSQGQERRRDKDANMLLSVTTMKQNSMKKVIAFQESAILGRTGRD
jgi:hypothetical protein